MASDCARAWARAGASAQSRQVLRVAAADAETRGSARVFLTARAPPGPGAFSPMGPASGTRPVMARSIRLRLRPTLGLAASLSFSRGQAPAGTGRDGPAGQTGPIVEQTVTGDGRGRRRGFVLGSILVD